MSPPKRTTFPSTMAILAMVEPIIREVIAAHGVDDLQALRRALRAAYPFPGGFDGSYTYQLWARECRRQIDAAYWSHKRAVHPLPIQPSMKGYASA